MNIEPGALVLVTFDIFGSPLLVKPGGNDMVVFKQGKVIGIRTALHGDHAVVVRYVSQTEVTLMKPLTGTDQGLISMAEEAMKNSAQPTTPTIPTIRMPTIHMPTCARPAIFFMVLGLALYFAVPPLWNACAGANARVIKAAPWPVPFMIGAATEWFVVLAFVYTFFKTGDLYSAMKNGTYYAIIGIAFKLVY